MRQFLHILFFRKWLILVPLIAAPVVAGALLLFTQPTYVSNFKLWTKQREEESKLLRVQRKGTQEDIYAKVQTQIIESDRVLRAVVLETGLDIPARNRSPFARLIRTKRVQPHKNHETAIVEAIKALRKNVKVDILNPEVIAVSVKMNNSKLAQEVAQALIDSYRNEYMEILLQEINEYEKFLSQRLKELDQQVRLKESELIVFERDNPCAMTEPRKTGKGDGKNPSILFVREMGDMSPVPMLLKRLADLEMRRNEIALTAGPHSLALRNIDKKIAADRKLLDGYRKTLSRQANLAVDHNRLRWSLEQARSHYTRIAEEYHKILISRGSKVRQISSITTLDAPTFDAQPVAPKKKMTILSAMFLGLLVGMALAYIGHLLDRTYHLPEELAKDVKIPVLATIPYYPSRDESAKGKDKAKHT